MSRPKMRPSDFFNHRNLIFLSLLLVLAVWPRVFSDSLLAQTGAANPVLGASYVCTPTGVAAFDTRVHVRCSAAAPGGIYFFAVSTNDSGRASRYLSVFTTAKVTGKNITIYYNTTDLSGAAWGCSNADCRNIWGAEVAN